MENMKYYEQHREPPKEALKPISGGRMNGKTDINPMWRIKALTEMFGAVGIGWYYKSVNKWIVQAGEESAAFVDIELFIKVDGEWSMPICGTGGSSFVSKEKNGLYVSDECYKMATTDALSVCCKQLGIAANVYWNSDNTKYNKQQTVQQNKQEKTSASNLIEKEELKVVTDLMARKGVTENQIAKWLLEKYKVSKLDSMPKEAFKPLVDKLNLTKDKD